MTEKETLRGDYKNLPFKFRMFLKKECYWLKDLSARWNVLKMNMRIFWYEEYKIVSNLDKL